MAEEQTKNNIDLLEIKKTVQKFEMVKGVIGLLFMAAKNHTMYPEDHAIYQESLQAVVSRLNPFLKNMATSGLM
jgi:hypothetical protein